MIAFSVSVLQGGRVLGHGVFYGVQAIQKNKPAEFTMAHDGSRFPTPLALSHLRNQLQFMWFSQFFSWISVNFNFIVILVEFSWIFLIVFFLFFQF